MYICRECSEEHDIETSTSPMHTRVTKCEIHGHLKDNWNHTAQCSWSGLSRPIGMEKEESKKHILKQINSEGKNG